ncbi:asparagine synthetase B family protein [Glycomyces sp. NPDC047369]
MPHAPGVPDVRYRSRPYVCGALGDWDPRRLAELAGAAPVRVKRVFEHGGLVLLASPGTAPWRDGARRGRTWGALADGPAPRTWREATEDRMAAGAASGPEGAALHTDALGLQDLYYRRLGDALYFAARIEPLLPVGGARSRVDWGAWASTLAMSSPVDDRTPFEAVKRVRAAGAWTWRDGRLRWEGFEPSWTGEEPDPDLRPEAALGVLDQIVAPDRRTALTLSGGWDSRLLGILATRRRKRMRAWTTSPDDGRDHDVAHAPAVAEALGLRHTVLIPGDDAWAEHHAEVWRRTGYQTIYHTWLMPLAETIGRERVRLLDGLAGDVLFGGSYLSAETLAPTTPEGRRAAMRQRMERRRTQVKALLRPDVEDAFEDLHADALEGAVSRFDGHHAALTLGALHTRTCRSIGASPMWVFAPETDVVLPFVHPEAVRTALRIPAEAKAGKAFYKRMLEAADPRTAALPSTNDPASGPLPPIGPRRQTGPAAIAALTGRIRSSAPVLDLLDGDLRADLLDPDVPDPVRGDTARFRILTWAGLLAAWLEDFAPHLDLDGGARP